MQIKLIALFLLAAALHVHARSQAQLITISGKDLPLKMIFSAIEKQTGYVVFARKQDMQETKSISLKVHEMPLEELLKIIMKDQPLDYVIRDKSIILSKKNTSTSSPGINKELIADPDPIRITLYGRTENSAGEPIIAAITVKGSTVGTTTDATGWFTLIIEEGQTIVITSVGYHSREIKVSSSAEVGRIVLALSESKLDQVIVKAYGTTTRRLNTGNISKVTAEQIASQPVTNPLAALEGRVPGMVVTQVNGLPGSAFKVEVQGRTAIDRTITDDQPLFIIDGVPTPTNNDPINRQWSPLGDPANNGLYMSGRLTGMSPLGSLNLNDIESVEVLKGADATAIYGSRGANGVVMITTKKGKAGKTKTEFNISTGSSKVAMPVEFAGTADYVAMRKAAFANDGVIPSDFNAYDFLTWDTTRQTDFYKLLAGNTARYTNAGLSFSGGSGTVQYLLSGNYRYQSTVLAGNSADKNTSLHFSIAGNSQDQRFRSVLTGTYASGINKLPVLLDPASKASLPPNLQLYDNQGNLAWNEGGIISQLISNPLAQLLGSYTVKTKNLSAAQQLSYKLLPDLTVRANLGYGFIQTDELGLNPGTMTNPALPANRRVEVNGNQFISYTVEPQIEYTKQLNKLKLNLLFGGSYQVTNSEGTAIITVGYNNDAMLSSLVGFTDLHASRYISEYRYEAAFSQANLNFDNKYILNLAVRRDGSSRFGPSKRFSNFGSAGAAWIFSNEKSIKNSLTWLSFGKLRSSFGITGNDKITDYQYLDTWAATDYGPYEGMPTLFPGKLFNGDYRWEKSDKFEAGIELGFWGDRILSTITYYSNQSKLPLVQYRLPRTTGFTSVVANLPARVSNTGWELTLTTTNIKTKDFTWTTNINLTIPKNKLASFENLENSSYSTTYVLGQPLDVIYKYKYTGVDPQTGVSNFEDINKDGFMSPDDYQVLGSTNAKSYGGLFNSFMYRNFQLDLLFSFRKQIGFSYLNEVAGTPPGGMENLPAAMKGFWEKPGDNANFQRLTQNYGAAYFSWLDLKSYSNAVYEDASFVRLRNISLSYQLPAAWMKKMKISQFRVFMQAQNLFTFTGYEIGDPESQSLQSTPPLKTIAGGIQLSF